MPYRHWDTLIGTLTINWVIHLSIRYVMICVGSMIWQDGFMPDFGISIYQTMNFLPWVQHGIHQISSNKHICWDMVIFEVSQFMNVWTWIWFWVLSQASKLVPWLLGLHLCSQPRGLATTGGAALLCCGGIFDEAGGDRPCCLVKGGFALPIRTFVQLKLLGLAIGTIVFEQNLRWKVQEFYFLSRLLRDSDISCYVCNFGPDMSCILWSATTWNSLPLPVCIYIYMCLIIFLRIYTERKKSLIPALHMDFCGS